MYLSEISGFEPNFDFGVINLSFVWESNEGFTITEFKYIDKSLIGRTQRVKRTRKRKEVKEQAIFYSKKHDI